MQPRPISTHVAADKDFPLAVHVEKQRGRPGHEFALRNLQLNRQRSLHGQAPSAEVGGGGAGGGIFENGAADRKEEPRQTRLS